MAKNTFGKGPNAVWLLLALLVLGVGYLFWYNSINRDVEVINYSKVLRAIENKQVESLVIQDQHVQGKFKDGRMFDAYVVPTQLFWDTVQTAQIDVEVYPQEKHSWVTFLLVMLVLLALLPLILYLRQSQGEWR